MTDPAKLVERLERASDLSRDKFVKNSPELFAIAAQLLRQQSSRIAELEEALRPFAHLRLSTEPEVSDLLHRSPASEMRLHAERIEQRDAAIRKARTTVSKEPNNG